MRDEIAGRDSVFLCSLLFFVEALWVASSLQRGLATKWRGCPLVGSLGKSPGGIARRLLQRSPVGLAPQGLPKCDLGMRKGRNRSRLLIRFALANPGPAGSTAGNRFLCAERTRTTSCPGQRGGTVGGGAQRLPEAAGTTVIDRRYRGVATTEFCRERA